MSVALVTGAGRGLGAAVAAELAARGHHVIVNYRRDAASAQAVADGITVVPGGMRTEASAHVITGDLEQRLAENSVLGRVMEPRDVAAAIAVAAGDELRAATGSTIRVDGGVVGAGWRPGQLISHIPDRLRVTPTIGRGRSAATGSSTVDVHAPRVAR